MDILYGDHISNINIAEGIMTTLHTGNRINSHRGHKRKLDDFFGGQGKASDQ